MACILRTGHEISRTNADFFQRLYRSVRHRSRGVSVWWHTDRQDSYFCGISQAFTIALGVPRLAFCIKRARQLNPNRIHALQNVLSPPAPTILWSIYILSLLTIVIAVADTIAALKAIESRDFTRTTRIFFITLTAAGTGLAAVLRILQSVVVSRSPASTDRSIYQHRTLIACEAFTDPRFSNLTLDFFITGSTVQVLAVSLRHLIRSPWRLPEQYQPFVAKTSRSFQQDSFEMDDVGPLALLYKRHEDEWAISEGQSSLALILRSSRRIHPFPISLSPTEDEKRRRAMKYPSYHAPGIPQVDLFDRYWTATGSAIGLRIFFLICGVHALLAASWEIARFAVNRAAKKPCRKSCALRFIYPWPLVAWMLVTIYLFRCRIAPRRVVFASLSAQTLIWTGFVLSILFWFVAAVVDMRGVHGKAFENWDLYKFIASLFGCAIVLSIVLANMTVRWESRGR